MGPSIKYVRPQMTIFDPPQSPLYSKIHFGLNPHHKRILETRFQNTMNVKKSKNINRTNP